MNEDFLRFSEMLMMEPMGSRANRGLSFKAQYTDEEIVKMRDELRNTFDKIQIILRQLSPYMLLVFRYFNLD
jgi:hypothetical protein